MPPPGILSLKIMAVRALAVEVDYLLNRQFWMILSLNFSCIGPPQIGPPNNHYELK